MRLKNDHVDNRHRISINQRRDKDGNPTDGLVITQARGFILMSREEWLELRERGDAILGIDQPTPRKRYLMV
ncbi:RND family transporter: Patched (Ptc) segmentation polarity protein [Mycolicibacterium rhodesiae JS60]|nr:RND family transporter: Patched (Ptc) segmentation polarity protein [Mycolicibacterium rhodesiae JS60]